MEPFQYADFEYLSLSLPDEVRFLRDAGDFAAEIRAIDALSAQPLPLCMKKRLWFEKMIAEGMAEDYSMTEEALFHRIQAKYPSLGQETFQKLLASGHADFILVRGERRYQDDCAANLLSCCKKTLEEAEHPDVPFVYPTDELLHENLRLMRDCGSRAFRFTVRLSLTVDREAQRPGEKIRVWLPFPAECASQSDIRLLETSGSPYLSSCAQPTVYFEKEYVPGEEFYVTFSYVHRATYKALSSAAVSTEQPHFYTEELLPHISFTPTMRALAEELRGGESNPLLVARRIYDYITTHVRYSYMRDYRIMENIPEFCAVNRRGDCGVQALLFITLCRYLGIPARWQSGNAVKPGGHVGSHDWAMFYIEPFGWLYADPSYGGGAKRRGDDVLCSHYFGNLDPFRMVCATDFQRPFSPEKTFLRHDPYDNQSGEAEYADAPIPGALLTRKKVLLAVEEL